MRKHVILPRAVCGMMAFAFSAFACSAAGKLPLSIEDAIATARPMVDPSGDSIFVSPDAKHYATLLVRGDMQRDGVWGELYFGQLKSLELASPKLGARLFTAGLGTDEGFGSLGGATDLTAPQMNYPVWIDNENVALLWEDDRHKKQVVSVEIDTGRIKYLTHHPADVLHFGIGPSGVLVYEGRKAYSRERSDELLHDGFVVTSPEIDPILAGLVDGMGGADVSSFERFVLTIDGLKEQKIVMHSGGINRYIARIGATWRLGELRFSPNGRWMIVDGSPAEIPSEWENYDSYELRRRLAEYADNPNDWYARQLQQLFIVDLSTSQARPLWRAPILPHGLDPLSLAWAPDGRSILLGPTFLPTATTDRAARTGKAVAIVEIDTNRVWQVPVPVDVVVSELRWPSRNAIEVVAKDRASFYFKKINDSWLSKPAPPARRREAVVGTIRVSLRQDLNSPPALFAIDTATSRERMVHDLDPQLRSDFELGRVESITWRDPYGRQWNGRLFYPTSFSGDRLYPLVIQTHTVAPEAEFSIYGPGGFLPGIGPGWAPFIAQPLANRGVVVLQLDDHVGSRGNQGGASGADRWMVGVEAAIEQLVQAGLVDRTKVGLMGWSSSGRQVEHALAFSKFPYAAALIGEHADENYFQAASYGWRQTQADWFGAQPFGEGLSVWLKYSPSFNVHQIRTPVQYQGTSSSESFSSLLWSWEMFSRLRHLRKPVEYYVVPDVRHGSHTLQNPRQLAAVQNRALDWWLFWLREERDPRPSKVEQYNEWTKMRALLAQQAVPSELSSEAVGPTMDAVNCSGRC